MTEYLRKQNLIRAWCKEICDCEPQNCRYNNEQYEMKNCTVVRFLKGQPAADVVEVVRCKDCKFWGSTLTPEEIEEARTDPNSDLVCDMWMSDGFSNDDYCSCGERRSNNG